MYDGGVASVRTSGGIIGEFLSLEVCIIKIKSIYLCISDGWIHSVDSRWSPLV